MGTTNHFVTIESELCCACGTCFGIESGLRKNLINNHIIFYCPNGHSQSYVGRTKEEILQDEVTRLKAKQDQLDADLASKDRKLKRVSKGVCPCCNRTFQNLQRRAPERPAMTNKPRWMICKIQVSIFGKEQTLIYNEDHSFTHMCDRDFGIKCLKDDLKGYFKCRFMNGEFYVHKRVSDKEW